MTDTSGATANGRPLLGESKHGWPIWANVTCVECPDCGFTMDYDHEDAAGGYSCPCCAEVAHKALEDAVRRAVRVMDSDPFPEGSAEYATVDALRTALAAIDESREGGGG